MELFLLLPALVLPVAAVTLLFVDWFVAPEIVSAQLYDFAGRDRLTAWEAFAWQDVTVAVLAAVVLGCATAAVGDRRRPAAGGATAALIGAALCATMAPDRPATAGSPWPLEATAAGWLAAGGLAFAAAGLVAFVFAIRDRKG
jgi:hypothetical protein